MPVKLHQYLALIQGKSSAKDKQFDRALAAARDHKSFDGSIRTYTPSKEDGETQDTKVVKVRNTATAVLSDAFRDAFSALADGELTLAVANAEAKADIKIGDEVLIKDAPVTFLLRMAHFMTNIRQLVEALPVLDPAQDWDYDKTKGFNVTRAGIRQATTKKTPHNHIKWTPPTPEYKQEAQVELYFTDDKIGEWLTHNWSGALDADRKRELLGRVTELEAAVLLARETANTHTVTDMKGKAGKPVFDGLLR